MTLYYVDVYLLIVETGLSVGPANAEREYI